MYGNKHGDISDTQSYIYSASEARNYGHGYGTLYDGSTIRGPIHGNQAASSGQYLADPAYDGVIPGSNYYGPIFAEHATSYYSPYQNTMTEECQWSDFSSNGFANIGSQFQLDQNLGPGRFQDLQTDADLSLYNPPSQTCSKDQILPNSAMPSISRAADFHVHDPCYSITKPIMQPDQGVFGTNETTALSIIPVVFQCVPSAETSFLRKTLRHSSSHHDALQDVASTPTSAQNTALQPSPQSLHTSTEAVDKDLSTSHPSQTVPPSFNSLRTLKPKPSQAAENYEQSETLSAMPTEDKVQHLLVSNTAPRLESDYVKCHWKGCSVERKGKNRKVNMRRHVRETHEPQDSPMCELCGKWYKTLSSLQRHLIKGKHKYKPSDLGQKVRKETVDGTVYTTYQGAHDYVDLSGNEKT